VHVGHGHAGTVRRRRHDLRRYGTRLHALSLLHPSQQVPIFDLKA
jgi:hypothetical protein